jgi:rubrerythrin
MTKSEQFLMEAFAGESQANRKYLAFAKQAEKEGYPQVAKLFRAAAEAETVHAHAHLRVAGGIKSTAENLKAAISGETHEFEHMYPQMITAAQAEGNKAAERSFNYANEVEKIHAGLYEKALANLDQNRKTSTTTVCSVCGYTCEDHPPEKCPVCNSGAKAFNKVV